MGFCTSQFPSGPQADELLLVLSAASKEKLGMCSLPRGQCYQKLPLAVPIAPVALHSSMQQDVPVIPAAFICSPRSFR